MRDSSKVDRPLIKSRLAGIWKLIKLVAWASLIAWVVATSAATAGAWLVFLNTHPSDGPTELLLTMILTVLWLPALLSDKVFHLASSPFHSPEDVVANIVAYVYETFATILVLTLVGRSVWSSFAGLRVRLMPRTKRREERASGIRDKEAAV